MDDFQQELISILKGEQKEGSQKIIDKSYEREADFIPVVKYNICYIVACVAFNENNEVLMMQEAKSSCCGSWYLPAGRVEQGESLIDAAKREAEEETGMLFDPEALIMVEIGPWNWYRFSFIGKVSGGKLKTLEESDKESLQAKWCPLTDVMANDKSILPLRAKDILKIIDKASKFKNLDLPFKAPTVSLIPHQQLLLQLMICLYDSNSNVMEIVTSSKERIHLPTTQVLMTPAFTYSIGELGQDIFRDIGRAKPKILGIVSVEHNGSIENKDGFCLTVLISASPTIANDIKRGQYSTLSVTDETLKEILVERLRPGSESGITLMCHKQ